MQKVAIVVPCYNESARFSAPEFARLQDVEGLRIFFVNDGSKDNTGSMLKEFSRRAPEQFTVLDLPQNGGKAEAVRQGMLKALATSPAWVGYVDADLATPVAEVRRIVMSLGEGPYHVVMGSRVRLLGAAIERRPLRHYLGRVFATFASMALRIPVYDTQCGAKFFKASRGLAAALEEPFRSRWVFDVELIGRLLSVGGLRASDFKELPLLEWKDIGGSKLTLRAMARAGWDLFSIGRNLRKNRGGHGEAARSAEGSSAQESQVTSL